MKRIYLQVMFLCCSLLALQPAGAQNVLKEKKPPTIMKYLVDAAPEFSTLVKSINTARLTETFQAEGPVTVFAPRNAAFEILPEGTVDNWLKPQMADSLQKMLTYHVVAGRWPPGDLKQQIKEAGGEFFLPTVGGGRISFILENDRVTVKDAHGFKTPLGIPIIETNGLIYPMNKLLLP